MTHADTGEVPLTAVLWSAIAPVYAAIRSHPFLVGLADGTLPRAAFQHYLVQDAHYLAGNAKALALCAAKAPDEQSTALFAEHAAATLTAERELHAALLLKLGTSAAQAVREPVGPTTRAYIDFLLATAYSGSYAEAIGAVLPCYWIYAKVAHELRAVESPDPLYSRWIAAYSGVEHRDVVGGVLVETDRIGVGRSGRETAAICAHAVTAARYEWKFWDAGWRCETWPI